MQKEKKCRALERQRLLLFQCFFRPTTMTISSTAVVFRFPNHLELAATPLFVRSLFLLTRTTFIFSSRLERPYVSLQLKRGRQSDLEEKRASAKEERKNLHRPTMGPSFAVRRRRCGRSLSSLSLPLSFSFCTYYRRWRSHLDSTIVFQASRRSTWGCEKEASNRGAARRAGRAKSNQRSKRGKQNRKMKKEKTRFFFHALALSSSLFSLNPSPAPPPPQPLH